MTDTVRARIEFTDQGSLRLDAETARLYFPSDTLVALVRGPELWLLPVRGAAAGGLLLKQRNLRGDRSVVLHGLFEREFPAGRHEAFWDAGHGALRVAFAAADGTVT